MPEKRRLITSKVCFGSEKAGLLENSYNKCALRQFKNDSIKTAKNSSFEIAEHFPSLYTWWKKRQFHFFFSTEWSRSYIVLALGTVHFSSDA